MNITDDEIMQILNSFNNCCFDELSDYIFDDDFVSKVDYSTIFNRAETRLGATKGVFILPDKDYVVKIPFEGYEDCGFQLNQYADEDDGWDYCKVEANRYTAAAEEGLGEFFAETYCIGHVQRHPIYVQERAKAFNHIVDFEEFKITQEVKNSAEIANSKLSSGHYGGECLSDTWVAILFQYCKEKLLNFEEKLSNLYQFISDFTINDLHTGNVGVVGNRPVLIDYSSYDEEY